METKAFHVKRMQKLLAVFESAKKVDGGYVLDLGKDRLLFDIGYWGTTLMGDFTHPKIVAAVTKKSANTMCGNERPESTCGMAACVGGTAGMIPEFRRAGLKTIIGDLTYDKMQSSSAAAFEDFFGLTEKEAIHICAPVMYEQYQKGQKVTPRHVVPKLEAAIKRQQQELSK